MISINTRSFSTTVTTLTNVLRNCLNQLICRDEMQNNEMLLSTEELYEQLLRYIATSKKTILYVKLKTKP